MLKKRKQNDNTTDSNRLGFHRGDYVVFASRFFSNHRMEKINLGTGIVIEKIMPGDKSLPALIVKFPFNHAFFVETALKALLENSSSADGHISVTVKVHPVYLEKA
jgi:hypothetical protein